jgi:enamine deaminase RidA (YjgF/YER057c/UK114 family)
MTPNVKITVTERNGRHCASTGSSWESAVGYSRAVRAGDFIFVTGTVGIQADGSYAPGLMAQTRRALDIIVAAVEALGGKAADIVRTRIFVTDIDKWKEAGAVHREFFDHVRPALTMVQVARLIDKEAVVEIEADALIHEEDRDRLA